MIARYDELSRTISMSSKESVKTRDRRQREKDEERSAEGRKKGGRELDNRASGSDQILQKIL